MVPPDSLNVFPLVCVLLAEDASKVEYRTNRQVHLAKLCNIVTCCRSKVKPVHEAFTAEGPDLLKECDTVKAQISRGRSAAAASAHLCSVVPVVATSSTSISRRPRKADRSSPAASAKAISRLVKRSASSQSAWGRVALTLCRAGLK